MKKLRLPAKQQGATLLVGLILLGVIMLMAVSAFMMSSSNLKSVGNLQFRNEAIAATNKAIEQVIGSPFTTAPAAETIDVDIDNDGKTDYVVAIATPTCIKADLASATAPSSLSLGPGFAVAATWNTVWDIDATVSDAASGASIRVHSGVRILLSQSQKDSVCP